MSVLVRPPDLIVRGPTEVMQAICADHPDEIQRLWAWFEARVGLRGRKMYGVVDVTSGTYATATPIRPGDDPRALGLQVGRLDGGRFRRGLLRGEPPGLYALIPPGCEEVDSAGPVDRGRPVIEHYKRRDEVEIWVPVKPDEIDAPVANARRGRSARQAR